MNRESYGISDTEWLFNNLHGCNSEIEILSLFKKLNGPLSLICFDKRTKKLYFWRDSLGRNSLLIGKNWTTIILSSVMGLNSIELFMINYSFSKINFQENLMMVHQQSNYQLWVCMFLIFLLVMH
jgi:hypothetical protein